MQTTHRPGNVEDHSSQIAAQLRTLLRPSGLGTSAALPPASRADACTGIQPPAGWAVHVPGAAGWSDPSAYAERPWGDGSASPLYCPRTERVDDALGNEVDERLTAWAADCGCRADELDALRQAGFGRLVMLAHADIDDPDALLVAAQMNTAWWAADDYYADNTEAGADLALLAPRLVLAMEALDPSPSARDLTAPLDEALRGDLVLRMLSSAVGHLARHGSPAQVQRACYATFAMFVSWNAYAAWREAGTFPPAWEYLTARQHDSFYTSMTLADPIGSYEVPADLYYDPRVRHAAFLAGTSSVLVNDLFSVAKDAADEKPVCNIVSLIAADRDCSLQEATEATVELHNDFVHEFEATHRDLMTLPSPELQRFLRALRAWMGGGFEWHATNPRYAQST
jgi:2-methylisoborneol synthase